MAKEPLYWEPEILSGMSTEAIVDKLKELVPGFDLNSFVAKTRILSGWRVKASCKLIA